MIPFIYIMYDLVIEMYFFVEKLYMLNIFLCHKPKKLFLMKKLWFFPVMLISIMSFGQSQFVVQNVTTQVFSNINLALAAANAGDTLYIPGGNYTVSSASIDKRLHWIGVGHYPAYTTATQSSKIITNLEFKGNCDGSSFEGIHFTGSLQFGSTDNDAVNILIKRCRVEGPIYLRTTSAGFPEINFHITESVVRSVDAMNGTNCLVEKNIITGEFSNFRQSLIRHNVINVNNYYGRFIHYTQSCTFENNAFGFNAGLYYTESCIFSHNLFAQALPFDPANPSFTSINNISNVGEANMFTSITGNIYNFSYENDYSLKSGNPGIGAASDGTDIGIYGSSKPYKPGAVPFYPHVTQFRVDPESTGGQLGVKITVQAQDQ